MKAEQLITATPWSASIQASLASEKPVLYINLEADAGRFEDIGDVLTPVSKAKLIAAVDETLTVIR